MRRAFVEQQQDTRPQEAGTGGGSAIHAVGAIGFRWRHSQDPLLREARASLSRMVRPASRQVTCTRSYHNHINPW